MNIREQGREMMEEYTIVKKSKNHPVKSEDAKSTLSMVALCLGEIRDGLTMINMQNTFLISSKNYTEKQAGIIFFVFGMSQFMFQAPAGYIMDYSNRKIFLLGFAAIMTTLLTLSTAFFAEERGRNLSLMVLIKFFQGSVTSLIAPGLNSITQGIVGSAGMTEQVSRNEMMNHFGTAIIVLSGSFLAFALYPNIGLLFIVSPISCGGALYFLKQIRPRDIDHNAARGLSLSSDTTSRHESFNDSSSFTNVQCYQPPKLDRREDNIISQPSFAFGFGEETILSNPFGNIKLEADTPLKVLRDPILLTFVFIVFTFHLANGTILPLVMQTLAIENGRRGILMSGLCIIIAQVLMVMSAKICGDYSGTYGRKHLFLIGLVSVPIRCLMLTLLLGFNKGIDSLYTNILILSTQLLDGIGAGIFGTMYILVTSDLSGGTGRFSLMLGITTAAMSIGGTFSGYLGEALAQDIGYFQSFIILGTISCIPVFLYYLFMPETLPEYSSEHNNSFEKHMTTNSKDNNVND